MSSIDKSVRWEAQKLDSRVRVVNSCGRIKGYIGSEKIFDIADRYGIMNLSERQIVSSSIEQYKRIEARLEEERRRREAEERKAALEDARSALERKSKEVKAAADRARRAVAGARAQLESTAEKLQAIGSDSVNLSTAQKLVQSTRQMLASALDEVEKKEKADLQELQKYRTTAITTTEDAYQRVRAINALNMGAVNVRAVGEANAAISRLSDILPLVSEVLGLAQKLRAAQAGSEEEKLVIKDALAEIGRTDISGLQAVETLKKSVGHYIARLRRLCEQQKEKQILDRLAELEASMASFNARAETFSQSGHYSVHSYVGQISQECAESEKLQEEISKFEYTGASREELSQLSERLENILLSGAGDELAYENAQFCRRRLEEILARARSCEAVYAEYKARRERILSYGADEEEIPAFRETDTEALFAQMQTLERDMRTRHEQTVMLTKRFSVERIMTECGFTLFKREQSGTDYIEEVFVREGLRDAVYHVLILPNGSVTLGLTGIRRADRVQTKPEKVIDCARQLREAGVISEVAEKFREAGAMITYALDDDADPAAVRAGLENTGYVYLSEEEEKEFDAATGVREEKGEAVSLAQNFVPAERATPEVYETVGRGSGVRSTAARNNALRNAHQAAL